MTNAHKPIIGVVGGIGSGKSVVAKMLSERGGHLILADELGHQALREPENRDCVIARWPSVRDAHGEIDRRELGHIVFADKGELRELESISFPWIGNQIRMELNMAQNHPNIAWVVLDAAIMLETGWNKVCDRIVYVDTPLTHRLQRVAQRGWTEEDLRKRELAQWPLAEKANFSDAVITNDGSLDDLRRQVAELRTRWELSAPIAFTESHG